MADAESGVDRGDLPADGPPGERPPGPDGLPLLGCTHRLLRDPLGFLDALAEYGDVVGYRVARIPFRAVLHPEYVEQVLVDEHDTYRRWTADEWNVLGGVAAEGLLLTEGEQWRRQRLLLQEAFTPRRVESYTETMVEYAERRATEWDDGETVAVDREMSRLTLHVLAKTLFDIDVRGREGTITEAARVLNEHAESSVATFVPDWLPTPANRRFERAIDDMHDLVDDLIARRRDGGGDRDDLLSVLLDAETEDGSTLSDREVRDQLVTFLFAGHETTALALTYALYLLARHPEKRRALDAELDAVLDDDRPSPATVGQLDYTERVVRETLRLYPPAYALFREATEDATLGGYAVPEGTKLTLPQYRIHRDPRFYDDPGTFRPERWTDGFEADLPDYAYFPFGGGPRHCIGMRFAMAELKHVLPAIARRVEFDPVDDSSLDLRPGLTLRPADPVELRVLKR